MDGRKRGEKNKTQQYWITVEKMALNVKKLDRMKMKKTAKK